MKALDQDRTDWTESRCKALAEAIAAWCRGEYFDD